jgi:hypothetical protein
LGSYLKESFQTEVALSFRNRCYLTPILFPYPPQHNSAIHEVILKRFLTELGMLAGYTGF